MEFVDSRNPFFLVTVDPPNPGSERGGLGRVSLVTPREVCQLLIRRTAG